MCTTEKLAARASSVQICPSCSDGNIASLSVPNTDCILLSKAYFHFITQLWDDDRDDDDKDTLVYLYNFHIASRSAFSRWSSGRSFRMGDIFEFKKRGGGGQPFLRSNLGTSNFCYNLESTPPRNHVPGAQQQFFYCSNTPWW
jgi:hypothetical protein